MTPVGHTLAGLAIATVAMPRDWSVRSRFATTAALVVLANAPDIPLPGWGHDRYDISHSIFVTLVGVLATAAVVRLAAGPGRIPWRLYLAGGLAWYSHLLMDSFYNHGKGIAIYWPFSDGRLALPVPWFSTMNPRDLFSLHNLQVWTIELAVFGAILFGAIAWRKKHADMPADMG